MIVSFLLPPEFIYPGVIVALWLLGVLVFLNARSRRGK